MRGLRAKPASSTLRTRRASEQQPSPSAASMVDKHEVEVIRMIGCSVTKLQLIDTFA
jgi:hypothetical protein